MRILVVGAGATGGYFGGRLLEAGRDVTFLVRPRRAAELSASGLIIRSAMGNVTLPHPPTVLAEEIREHFDLILLSAKAYDLENAMDSFAAAVDEQTAILPMLNGMRHLDMLDRRFGAARVLGGLCVISSSLEPGGVVAHLNDLHLLSYGERDGRRTPRVEAIEREFAGAKFIASLNEHILQSMWEKWVFIAAAAALTCTMRATVGDILAAGGERVGLDLLGECAAIAAAEGYAPREENLQLSRTILTTPGSLLAASMLRDIERRGRIEAEHTVGDLLGRGEARGVATPLLALAYTHLLAYEARRVREGWS